jgi:uncharacterized protein (DUF488 family)
MKLFTIGFTQSSAAHFFGRLRQAGVRRLIDVRLNNTSQLSGFAKAEDLGFFAQALCGIETLHLTELAPTVAMLHGYRNNKAANWTAYAAQFRRLIARRKIERLDRKLFDGACLLCSEATPHRCHRRLVAEYLQEHWPGIGVEHL